VTAGWDGRTALVAAGYAGHDREITVNVDGWDHPFRRQVPDEFEKAVRALLPPGWKIENRSTRLEVHPSGHFAGGYAPEDVRLTANALRRLGLEVEVRERGTRGP
jgi:hypothetical protein